MTFLIFLIVGVAYASFFEWLLHRYVMHRPFRLFRRAYNSHAKVHHALFTADSSYHLAGHEHDQATIPMAWWNGPALVAISSSPFWVAGWFFGNLVAPLAATVAIGGYYVTYEYFHWCMHKPKNRWFEGTRAFRFANGHHLLHHRYVKKNFNVVLPLAD